MQIMKVADHILRATTYLPNGQRCEQWLPAGEYQIVGECTLNERDATQLERTVSGKVCGRDHQYTQTWYIGRF